MCITRAVSLACDIFAHKCPVAALNGVDGFNVRRMREAEQLDLSGLMSVHMRGVEGQTVQLSVRPSQRLKKSGV